VNPGVVSQYAELMHQTGKRDYPLVCPECGREHFGHFTNPDENGACIFSIVPFPPEDPHL